ncbi:EAL domain-containing protein [Sphingosinicella sp. BN140058]|uniref:bifunctional diguanylate cyclase/phosphodiesterase n=1 Tax=Sphingosinicella sp. BN140058 TaxID=1892855 RepID=UPI001010DAD8|nr:EAL domain-containing protein [Sphingosinicella sp. BN140058]QAY77275.1 EAL domain-containing protein [Sphingosinicella sp. BN140058]
MIHEPDEVFARGASAKNARPDIDPQRVTQLVDDLASLSDDLCAAQRIAKLGIWRWRVGTQDFTWSHEMFRIAGRQEADFTPTLESSMACIHPDDRASMRGRLQGCINSRTHSAAEFRVVRPDGEIRYCWAETRPILDSFGRVLSVRGICQDITDRKTIEGALRESEEHYRYTLELSPQIPWAADPAGQIIEVSAQGFDAIGRTPDETLGDGWLAVVHPDDRARTLVNWQHALRTGEPLDTAYRLMRHDQEYRWVRARAGARRSADGSILRWYGTLDDIDDQKKAEAALLNMQELYRLAVRATGLGIWDFDHETGARRWSGELRAMLGLGADAPADASRFLGLVHPDDRDAVIASMQSEDEVHAEMTFRIRRADTGTLRWLTIDIRAMSAEGDTGGSGSRTIVAFRDVTDRKAAQDHVEWAARHDPLTGLANRVLFQEQLQAAVSASLAGGERSALLLIDLDDFKLVNDTLGHDSGDQLLRLSGQRIETVVRPGDTVARLGGDEFAIVLPQIGSEDEVLDIAEAILAALGAPARVNGQLVDIRASIGVTTSADGEGGAEELLKHADIALYVSKGAGRGRVTLFHPEMRASIQQRASMLSLARYALSADLVEPFYQPQVDLSSGALIGFEALLRWRHPRLGLQLPGSVAAAFEDNELATSISDRMFERTIADMRCWLQDGLDFGHVAVNASAAEFRRDNFAERVLTLLRAGDVPPSRLELEVTETVFLGRGSELVDRALNLLSSEGVKIALDDFGTGYASLSHLKRFPVDIIKIDQSFIRDIEDDPEDAAIVSALITLGNSLGLKTVAEGIETERQARCLTAQGCTIGQGHYFGRPMPTNMARQLVADWPALGHRLTAAR